MPDAIVVTFRLEPTGVAEAGKKASQQLDNALEAGRSRALALTRQHSQRLEQIAKLSAAQIEIIERKKQAQLEVIHERAVQKQIDAQRRLERASQAGAASFQTFMRRHSATIREAGESLQAAGFAALSLTAAVVGVGRAAFRSAVEIDQQVNTLRALTGSSEAAEKRFAQLVATAQKTPGLTASLAATLDAQLRVANVTQQTIDKVLPAIGKLNAVSPLGDPQKLANNLVQLVTQGFERSDLKELVGQSPLAGELIKQIFNVESPTNAKAIRAAAQRLGITTVDRFFTEIANAAANNPKLQNVTESLGTAFEKMRDRAIVALRPIGLTLVATLAPLVERAIPIIEKISAAFAALPAPVRQVVVVVGLLAAALGPLLIIAGGLIQTFGALGSLVSVFAGASGVAGVATAGFAIAFKPLLIVLAAVAVAAGVAFGAYKLYTLATEDNTQEVRENARAAQAQITTSQRQVEELRNLAEKTNLTRGETEKIRKLYDGLDPVQRERVKLFAEEAGGVDTLSGKLAGLLVLMEREQELRKEQARTKAFEQGPDIVKEALQAQSTLNFVSTNLNRLTTERERLAREIALATDSAFLGKRPVEERVLVPNPTTFGIRTETRRTTQLEVLQKQFADANRQLTALESERTKLQGRVRAAAQDIQISAFGAGLSPSQFAAQFVGGDIDKFNALTSVLGTSPLVAPAPTKTPPRPGGGGGGAGDSAARARALRDAQLAFTKELAENELKLVRDINERGIKDLQEALDRGKITLREFFEFRQNLSLDTLDHELLNLSKQEDALRKAFEQAKGADRVRLEAQLNDVLTEQTLKRKEILDVIIETTREFLKAAALPAVVSAEQVALIEKAKTVTEQFAAAIAKATGESAKLVEERLNLRKVVVDDEKRLKENIRQLKAQLQFGGENFGLRAEQAQLEAIFEIKKADEEAVLSMIQNRERLADASVFHADRANAIFLDHLANQQSVTEAVAEAQIKAFEGVAGSLDRGIDRLTKKLGLFGDVINGIIKSIVRNLLANLFAPTFGGGAGGGSILGSILQGVFGPAGGGLASNVFRTPSTFPGGGAFNFAGLAGLAAGAIPGFGAASSLAAPLSISSLGIPGLNTVLRASQQSRASQAANTGFGALLSNFGNLFQGFGFGLKPGAATGQLAAAAPLLGLTLGAGLGGTSRFGQIVGGAGGALVGIGISAAPAGAGFLAPLFSNPITAIIGAGLLVGAIFLGRASQRRKDEAASGEMLGQAMRAIEQLKAGIASDQIDGSQARAIFENDILGTFRQQINTLKTKSVRESRLTNQVRDLGKMYDALIPPEIEAQKQRRADEAQRQFVSSRLIPEFAIGGVARGGLRGRDSVLSLLTPGEMVLTAQHQHAIQALAGADVFNRVGVPGIQPNATFPTGGIAPTDGGRAPIEITIEEVVLALSDDDATKLYVRGAQTKDGQTVTLKTMRRARGLGEF